MKKEKPSKFQIWKLASRPHTLTASIVPVFTSWSILSFWEHYYSQEIDDTTTTATISSNNGNEDTIGIGLLAFYFATFACLIQIGTNLHNDYADFVKGADTEERVGQARATQKGWLTPKETASGSTFCLVLAMAIGMSLTKQASRSNYYLGLDPFMLFITFSSVFNAVCYTGGPYPLGYIGLGHLSIGYSGLGDLFVFLYFGIVATITTPYLYLRIIQQNYQPLLTLLQQNTLLQTSCIVSIPIGLLSTNIIVVNNLRDRLTDVHAGKRTMAVRFGETFCRCQYTFSLIASYGMLCMIVYSTILGNNGTNDAKKKSWLLYLPLASLPLAWKELQAVGVGNKVKDGADLNVHVGGAARVQLLYCLLLSIGILMQKD